MQFIFSEKNSKKKLYRYFLKILLIFLMTLECIFAQSAVEYTDCSSAEA